MDLLLTIILGVVMGGIVLALLPYALIAISIIIVSAYDMLFNGIPPKKVDDD
jgi:hypothetical protein